MSKITLTALAVAAFIVFGVFLSIGIGISGKDLAYDNQSQIYDHELRIENIESRVIDIEWRLR